MDMKKYLVGDYVIADHALYDNYDEQTFAVYGRTRNLLGETLIRVRDIATNELFVFYPRELSYEDGTRGER